MYPKSSVRGDCISDVRPNDIDRYYVSTEKVPLAMTRRDIRYVEGWIGRGGVRTSPPPLRIICRLPNASGYGFPHS